MNVSVQHLLAAVTQSLEREVLPHLDPQATPASNVRACLMLLANIQTRVTHEARLLFEDNRELRTLLTEAAERADALGLDQALAGTVRTALQDHPAQTTWFDADGAATENRHYQELLTAVIEGLHGQLSDKREFRERLHAYLQRLSQRDLQLVESALTRTPV
ncbi:MAG: hypothetical protein ABW110_19190 [Steroidobacteraceae bacterium]